MERAKNVIVTMNVYTGLFRYQIPFFNSQRTLRYILEYCNTPIQIYKDGNGKVLGGSVLSCIHRMYLISHSSCNAVCLEILKRLKQGLKLLRIYKLQLSHEVFSRDMFQKLTLNQQLSTSDRPDG